MRSNAIEMVRDCKDHGGQCFVNDNKQHVPQRSCTCDGVVYSKSCPVDGHRRWAAQDTRCR